MTQSRPTQSRYAGTLMDPDAVYQAQAEHDHEDERAAIADQRQWHTGDWQHCDCHSYVLKDVGEDKRSDADDEKKTQLVSCEKRDEKTRHQEQGKGTDKDYSADESPLLADSRENVVIMHRCRRQKPELDLGIGRFEPFSGPPS